MANGTAPVTALPDFISAAKGVGIYNGSQAANLSQALKLTLEQAKALGTDIDTLTVSAAHAGVDQWLDEYGANNKASVLSIATYKGRAKKVLDDFIKWNGGNFMEWKKTIAKTPKATRKAKTSKPKTQETGQTDSKNSSNGGENTPEHKGTHVHVFRLPNNKIGKLTLPDPITNAEIDAAWKVLDAYKTLLTAQAGIDAGAIDESDHEGVSE